MTGIKLGRGDRLVLASHNRGKLAEIADLLRPFGLDLVVAASLGLPEPPEDAPDFAGNARVKALAAACASGLPALADDSGFSVAALNGAPGVHSARWAGPGRDFAPGHGAGEHDDRCGRRSPGLVHGGALPGLARWAYRHIPWPGGWHGRLAATGRQGIRLRPDVSSRRVRSNVRGDGSRRETRGQSPGQSVRATPYRVFGVTAHSGVSASGPMPILLGTHASNGGADVRRCHVSPIDLCAADRRSNRRPGLGRDNEGTRHGRLRNHWTAAQQRRVRDAGGAISNRPAVPQSRCHGAARVRARGVQGTSTIRCQT